MRRAAIVRRKYIQGHAHRYSSNKLRHIARNFESERKDKSGNISDEIWIDAVSASFIKNRFLLDLGATQHTSKILGSFLQLKRLNQ